MSEKTPQDVNRIQEEAQKQDLEAQKAQEVVEDAISKMTPQRQYEKEKEQNKR
ncbi:hypothetical protein IIE26_11470 [Cytobacillus oceanisediminis]|uniref:hypothetical protein n=1 Tax=Cytobacillus oceanisediminis TaxID=665099 RepID=UPI001863CA89|nr:hypothetical protein [Cytobacillus oceanisediminis]QOK29230.1 hypothetical protein IIE26_11470 [Cytobacillus oceanisediminis]